MSKNSRNVELFIHPYCLSSYIVVKNIIKNGLADKLIIVNTESSLDKVLLRHIISVPWLVYQGADVATDPLEPELVIGFIKNDEEVIKRFVPRNVEESIDYFKKGVLSSIYASIVVFINNSFKPLLNTIFGKVASRISLAEHINYVEFKQIIKFNEDRLIEEIESKLYKVIAKNIIREIYWIKRGQDKVYEEVVNLDKYKILLWIIAKLSIGRAIVPVEKLTSNTLIRKLDRIEEILEQYLDMYVNSIQKEINTIENDNEYKEVIRKYEYH